MVRGASILIGTAAIVVTAGCVPPPDTYTLEITVERDVMSRKLTVCGPDGKPVSAEVLAAIGKAYGKAPATEGAEQTLFAGRFTGTTPDDVGGGSGSLLCYASPLGDAYAYAETFRGNDRPAEIAKAQLEAADVLVDFVRGLMRKEFGAKEGFTELDRFLDGEFRGDMKDFLLYASRLDRLDDDPYRLLPFSEEKERVEEKAWHESFARTLQFLFRRGYLPRQFFAEFTINEETAFMRLVPHLLRTKTSMGNPDALAKAITDFFGDKQRVRQSVSEYYMKLPEYLALAKSRGYDPAGGQAMPDDVYEICSDLSGKKVEALKCELPFLARRDELSVTLHVPVEPLYLNGTWNEKHGIVRWAGKIHPRSQAYFHLPAICYATWVVPNKAAQERLFGKTALCGGKLFWFALWLNSLPKTQCDAVGAILAGTRAEAAKALRELRLEGEDKAAVQRHNPLEDVLALLENPPVVVASYYFGNYHPGDPRNAVRKGKDWSEWELVKNAKPRFPGHVQPKVPLWGYQDESDPKVMAQKIDAAADHGIDVFIFDWYYYDDGPFLQRPIDEGFLKAPNNARIKFAFMWANHDWWEIHPYKRATPYEVVYPGKVTPATFGKICDHVIKDYFAHPSYWRIEGKPYFSFYDLSTLLANFGSVAAARAALDEFRAKAVAAGLPGLHLNAVVWGQPVLPGEKTPIDAAALVRDLGFDAVTSYVWVHHVPLNSQVTDYNLVRDEYLKYWDRAEKTFDVPYFPNVSMGWDSSPRAAQEDPFDNSGYPFTNTIGNNTPEHFTQALELTRERLRSRKDGPRIFNINCWNEWTEGSYLEPDTVNGVKYLEAVKAVFPPAGAHAPDAERTR